MKVNTDLIGSVTKSIMRLLFIQLISTLLPTDHHESMIDI